MWMMALVVLGALLCISHHDHSDRHMYHKISRRWPTQINAHLGLP
jgi:hypothetical protein